MVLGAPADLCRLGFASPDRRRWRFGTRSDALGSPAQVRILSLPIEARRLSRGGSVAERLRRCTRTFERGRPGDFFFSSSFFFFFFPSAPLPRRCRNGLRWSPPTSHPLLSRRPGLGRQRRRLVRLQPACERRRSRGEELRRAILLHNEILRRRRIRRMGWGGRLNLWGGSWSPARPRPRCTRGRRSCSPGSCRIPPRLQCRPAPRCSSPCRGSACA